MSLSKFFATLQRQRVAVIAVLVVGVVLFVIALPHFRRYTATATLLAAAPASNTGAVLDPTKDPVASAVGPGDLENLATSSTILDRVASDLRLSDENAARLSREVKVRALYGSDILPVQVSDRNPDLSIDAANTLAKELAVYSREISTSRYDELIADLRSQVEMRRAELKKIDAMIQGVSSANFYVTPDGGTTALNTRLVALDAEAQQLQATVDGDEANAAAFSKRPALSEHLAGHEIATQDPVVTALRTQFGKDLAALNNMKAGYTDQYPGIAGLQDTVDREGASMKTAETAETQDLTRSPAYVSALLDANKANATLDADRAQLADVRSQIAALGGRLDASGGQGSSIAELRRERAAGEDAFAQLSSRLAKAVADRSQAASIGSVVMIDKATYAAPALLGRPGVLGAAFGVAFLWIAISLAFILDGADSRLRDKTSIEDLYGKPVFGPVG